MTVLHQLRNYLAYTQDIAYLRNMSKYRLLVAEDTTAKEQEKAPRRILRVLRLLRVVDREGPALDGPLANPGSQ